MACINTASPAAGGGASSIIQRLQGRESAHYHMKACPRLLCDSKHVLLRAQVTPTTVTQRQSWEAELRQLTQSRQFSQHFVCGEGLDNAWGCMSTLFLHTKPMWWPLQHKETTYDAGCFRSHSGDSCDRQDEPHGHQTRASSQGVLMLSYHN